MLFIRKKCHETLISDCGFGSFLNTQHFISRKKLCNYNRLVKHVQLSTVYAIYQKGGGTPFKSKKK